MPGSSLGHGSVQARRQHLNVFLAEGCLLLIQLLDFGGVGEVPITRTPCITGKQSNMNAPMCAEKNT